MVPKGQHRRFLLLITAICRINAQNNSTIEQLEPSQLLLEKTTPNAWIQMILTVTKLGWDAPS